MATYDQVRAACIAYNQVLAGQDDDGRNQVEAMAAALAAALPAYKIPGPYDIAMAFGAAAVMSGKYESIEAAMGAAWAAIPGFWNGRDLYQTQIGPMYFGASTAEAPHDRTPGGEERS